MLVESEFFRGNYGRILAGTVDSPAGLVPPDAVAYVIGALTFRGRLDEAESVYRLFRAGMDELAAYTARFFLGVGLVRHSHHAKGRALLAENLVGGSRHQNPKIRFYVWQGAGYYRLTGCRFRDAVRYASLALNSALEANFLYGKALASDLLAHSQVGPGQIQASGENFRRALAYADLLGDGGLSQAIHVSLVIHSAQHGLDPAGDVASLERLQAQLTLEDNYSKSRLLLELGRQHLLRGQVARAKVCLDDACRLVYASQNRRYGIILNMRYAYIMHLAGEHLPALNLMRNAAKTLDPSVDRQVAMEVVGLEQRLLAFVPCPTLDQERAQGRKRLDVLTKATGRAVSQRMLNRDTFRGYNNLSLIGDDPLGDLVDLSKSRSESAVARIIDSGYLQLLAAKLALPTGGVGLYVDVLPGALLAYDKGEMHLVPVGVSHVIRTLLACFAQGTTSKEELIRAIWRYQYNPLKHDQLIYTAVSRLRQLLGPFSTWVEVTEAGYRLRPDVALHLAPAMTAVPMQLGQLSHSPGPDAEADAEPASFASAASQRGARATEQQRDVDHLATHGSIAATPKHGVSASANLNHRQIGILQVLRELEFVDARTCSGRFQVSEVSARRDLSYLTQQGLLQRHGKGRATRYSLTLNEAR